MDQNEQPTIEVCFGPQCSDCGGRQLAAELRAAGLEIIEGDCRSFCPNAPGVLVNNHLISKATAAKVLQRVEDIRTGKWRSPYD